MNKRAETGLTDPTNSLIVFILIVVGIVSILLGLALREFKLSIFGGITIIITIFGIIFEKSMNK